MIIFVPGSFFFRQYKDRFHKRVGYGCVLTYRSEVRHERCEVYADVFTTTDIVLYIIHLLTYDDIVAINIITAYVYLML